MGYVSIIDTIQKNNIFGRSYNAKVNQIIIRDTTILKEKLRNQVYVGGNLGVDNTGLFNYFGPSLLLKTKTDKIYNLGVGINNNKGSSCYLAPIKIQTSPKPFPVILSSYRQDHPSNSSSPK